MQTILISIFLHWIHTIEDSHYGDGSIDFFNSASNLNYVKDVNVFWDAASRYFKTRLIRHQEEVLYLPLSDVFMIISIFNKDSYLLCI